MDNQDNTVSVNVKWMTKLYSDLKMYLDEPLDTFKVQLWTLTGVPPERQKIMFKGIIPNDADLRKLKIANGAKLMLIGSADKPPECNEKIRFFEELTSVEKAKLMKNNKIKKMPPGIMNLGNTCYFNSVLQFLFPVTELWTYVSKLMKTPEPSVDTSFAKSLLEMKTQLSFSLERYVPLVQIQGLRKLNPLFCRKDEKTGIYMQQDAEECLNCILSHLNGLSDEKISQKTFGFSLVSKIEPIKSEKSDDIKALEADKDDKELEYTTSVDHNLLLSCYMGTPLKSVGTLMDGISLSLNEEILKFSEKLGSDVMHKKVSLLSSLPRYLIAHLVRFEWKQKSNVSLSDSIKAKICRRVNFERFIDVTSLCEEDLQKKLRAARSYELKKEDAENMEVDKEDNGNKAEHKTEVNPEKPAIDGYQLSEGEYATGKYELISIVTHQGRTADAGHYICWSKDTRDMKSSGTTEEAGVKKGKTEDKWLKFDDDVVTEHDWGTFDLCGGRSDYHIAVLLLYKAQTTTS
ncbi:ubiquitin carboxyl-terminal hydrolase [Theileria orientalis]|uniref:Ubiquitin carboxyl-terminal hydrolase n=1 Tax=Theileria orientalis TaxID=68886 RepID=A0A976QXJ2_THEOR|nr:ubiquitin carboxyl-terminal hydrolase [Theileria orientalis]